jgi:hypothetical protein
MSGVPFLNLTRPRQVMADIWDAGRPAGARGHHGLVRFSRFEARPCMPEESSGCSSGVSGAGSE